MVDKTAFHAWRIIGGFLLPIIVLASGTACERRDLGTREDTSPILVSVDGSRLTKSEFDLYLPADYQDILTSEELQEYLDHWITTQLLYNEGRRRGIDGSMEIESRLEQYRKDLVGDLLVQHIIDKEATVSEDEAKAYYDAHAYEYQTEFRVSHILVDTMEEAEKVKEKIGQNSFAYLARRYSIDKHSGAGGDLGYLSKGNMLPEFENVVFHMKKGEVSDIIESEFGYHILMVTDIREARFPLEFEDAKDEISNDLLLEKRAAVYDSLVTALRAKAKIVVTDAVRGLGLPSEPDTIPEQE